MQFERCQARLKTTRSPGVRFHELTEAALLAPQFSCLARCAGMSPAQYRCEKIRPRILGLVVKVS